MSVQRFRTVLQLHGRTATGIEVPPAVVEALGGGRRVPVSATLQAVGHEGGSENEGHTYRTTVASMGGKLLIPVSAEHRTAAGLAAGDEVDVTLAPDAEPRVVEVPDDLAAALDQDPTARAFFDGLAFTHRKEYARWVTDAKRAETRERRVAQAVEQLHEGRRRS